MSTDQTADRLADFLTAHAALILVQVTSTKGSAPRENDAFMLVAAAALYGTIGGGRLELDAITAARQMLATNEIDLTQDITLGHDISQCCGGVVALSFAKITDAIRHELLAEQAAQRKKQSDILIFGAGHVGRALAIALAPLPFNVSLIDTRADALQPPINGVTNVLAAISEQCVREARPGSSVVVMTHEHAQDFLITAEALKRGDMAYVGLIGSKTKKAVLRAQFLADGGTLAEFAKLISPIGANPTGDKRPEVIAAFVVAELCSRLLMPQHLAAPTVAG